MVMGFPLIIVLSSLTAMFITPNSFLSTFHLLFNMYLDMDLNKGMR
jgi:hypothetical protein